MLRPIDEIHTRGAAVFKGVVLSALLLASAAPAAAQNEAALKSYFEGQRVTLRMDMPGTADGVDVHADAKRAIDYDRYKDNLKHYGTAIRAGDTVVVTLVKVKKDLIEFQLGGGGFGTFGDDTSTSSNLPLLEKSSRERELEKRIKDEDDRERRRRLERELDDLRDRRERENQRIMAARERIEAQKRERIAEERLRGGSRFNLRYDDRVPAGMRPEDMIAALTEYVDFGGPAPVRASAAPAASGDVSMLRKGLSRAETERLFGSPVGSSERREGGLMVTTLVFNLADQRISADFVDDVLISYSVMSR
jgi:hypothetical protein